MLSIFRKNRISHVSKKLIAMLLALAIIFGMNTFENIEAASLKISATSISLAKGSSYTLKIKNNTKKDTVTWSTSNKYAVTVSGGVVKAVNKGFAVIKAKCDGKTFTCRVYVPDSSRTVALNAKSINLVEGGAFTLTAGGKTVTYRSLNTAIATVNSSGKVTAKNPGKTSILVSSTTGFAYCSVNVTRATYYMPSEKAWLTNRGKTAVRRYTKNWNPTYGTITWTAKKTIHFGIDNFQYYDVKKIVWSVNKGNLMTKPSPSSNGEKATAKTLKAGKVKVIATVTYRSGKKKIYSNTVYISNPKPNKKTVYLFTSGAGSNRYQYVSFSGLSDYSKISYTNSSTKKVSAALVGKKCKVTGKKKGSSTITATVDGKKIKVKCKVKKLKLGSIIGVLAKGNTTTIKISGIGKMSKKFYSENSSIATVDANGVITGKKSGVTYVDVKISTMLFRYRVDVAAKGMKTIISRAQYIVNNWKYSQGSRMKDGYYDCSALVWKGYKAYKNYNLKLGGSNTAALSAGDLFDYLYGKKQIIYYGYTKLDDLKPGDLLFYGDYNSAVKYSTPGRTLDIYHVSMYAGNGKVVEKGGKPITYNNLEHVVGIGRVVN